MIRTASAPQHGGDAQINQPKTLKGFFFFFFFSVYLLSFRDLALFWLPENVREVLIGLSWFNCETDFFRE